MTTRLLLNVLVILSHELPVLMLAGLNVCLLSCLSCSASGGGPDPKPRGGPPGASPRAAEPGYDTPLFGNPFEDFFGGLLEGAKRLFDNVAQVRQHMSCIRLRTVSCLGPIVSKRGPLRHHSATCILP